MAPQDNTLTSDDIGQAIAFITNGEDLDIAELKALIASRFEDVMQLAEIDAGIGALVLKFKKQGKKLQLPQVKKFRALLLKNLVTWDLAASPIPDTKKLPEKPKDWSEYGNETLANLALQIRLLYTSDWFSSAKIKDFSDAAAEYIQIFLQFYSDDSSDLKKTAPGGVKVQEKKRGEKQKKGQWTESDEDDLVSSIETGDMIILRLIFSMIQSYIDVVKRKMEKVSTLKKTRHLLQAEKKSQQWTHLSKIIIFIKKLRFQNEIIIDMNKFDVNFEDMMIVFLEECDAIAMQMDEKGK